MTTSAREIRIRVGAEWYETKTFTFPGGELQVRLPELPTQPRGDATVLARVQSSDDLVRLILTAELIDRRLWTCDRRRLVLPYFPCARQDRVMEPDEAFSLKAVARVVDGLGFDEVVICDPHSDVAPALVRNARVVKQVDLLANHLGAWRLLLTEPVTLIGGDASATKKLMPIAKRFTRPIVTARKVRNVRTGEITGTKVDDPDGLVAGRPCLIVDDICDGGRTFIELAKALRGAGPASLHLYVTHGIFSKGLSVFENLFNGIFCTDTFLSENILDTRYMPLDIGDFNRGGICY